MAGTVTSSFGYCFGEQLWSCKIKFQEQLNLANAEFSGIMIVGVINKKGNFGGVSKVIGSVVNYTLTGGDIPVKLLLDISKRQLIVYSHNKPEGEVFSDLPKDGQFYPAIQNKTQKFSNNAKLLVEYQFDLPIPKDRSQIMNMAEEVSDDGESSEEQKKTMDLGMTKLELETD